MQNIIKFLYLILFIGLNFNSLAFESFSIEALKNTADSLFTQKNYVDAKLIYDEIYFNRNIKSDDIILKSALINEGLKQFEWTLFFLEKYLQAHPNDEKTEAKINQITQQNNLTGYEKDDLSLIFNFIIYYQIEILAIISLLLITFLILNQLKKNKYFTVIAVSVFLLIITVMFQSYSSKSEAIVIENSFLMEAPSGASNQLQKIKPGNKIIILDEVDIWLKISANDKEAYILKSKVIEI